MEKLRWGIIGTANIAKQFVVPAMHAADNAEPVAVASRDRHKSETFARENNIPRWHDSYEALLDDPDVDAVYNPLPNHLHVPVSVQAIKAGKHVLCEKPLGLNAADTRPVLDAAAEHPELVVMEAFMYRFHPQWIRVREMIDAGELGDITAVQADFTYFNTDPDDVRNRADIGGGAILDIGCYCVSVARFVFGREPRRVISQIDGDPQFNTDRHASGVLDFAPGTATFYCSTQSAPSQGVRILGTQGSLTVENPFYRRGEPSRVFVRQGDKDEVITVGDFDQYMIEVNAFSRAALQGGAAPTPLSDALANMKVLDGLFASADSEEWIEIG